MHESTSSGIPPGPAGTQARVSGEIVHEQTVRAPIPTVPTSETTVRAPMPVAPQEQAVAPQEQTVRAFVASAVPSGASELEELDVLEVEPDDGAHAKPAPAALDVGALVSELEAQARRRGPETDAPTTRADQITVPEAAAPLPAHLEGPATEPRLRRPRRVSEAPPLRSEPPAVVGEVSVSEPEPDGIFDPAPRRSEPRPRAAVARPSKPRRDDPPSVSGEVAIVPSSSPSPEIPAGDIRVLSTVATSGPQPMMASSGSHPIMLASGPQPIMSASGPQPMMASSGSHPIMTASGTSPVVPRRANTHGPGSRDATGPHPLMRGSARSGSHDNLVLWVLAGALVVLALAGVMLLIAWTQ
jgi:hypothetical protein